MARYIVNPGNAVHSVEEGEFKRLTLLPGYRAATTEEIAGWYEMQGLPVPSEFSPDPQSPPDAPSATDETDANKNDSSIQQPDLQAGATSKRARASRRRSGV